MLDPAGHRADRIANSSQRSHHARARSIVILVTVAAILSACNDSDAPSILEPAGPASARIERLWWVMLWISVIVFAVVTVMLFVAIARGRGREGDLDRSDVRWGEPFVAIAGVLLPAVILGGVFLYSLREMNALAGGDRGASLTIEIEGRNWWWEARYPNGAVTANEIHIPAGEPVRLRLLSADVIHSFWVPRLQAKTDLIPGATNQMWLEADEPGTYRGQCAEFCGLQHSNMIFYVIAEPRDEFEEWVANEARPAPTPASQAGEDIFMSSTCVGCHAIRGTEASADLGPDLTHLASRSRIGAGVMANTRSNLERFIVDPQSVKPGASMPPTSLSDDELSALLDYLEGLE